MKRLLVILIIFGASFCAGILPVFSPVAAQGSDDAIVIASPGDGEVVVGHNAEFNGEAPKNTLVTIEITDADTNRPLVEHQKFGHISGSTTSDAEGDWVFVPQQELVPGKFTVQASYKDNKDGHVVKSEEYTFTVVDDGGSSGRFSDQTIRRILVGAIILGLILITVVIGLIHHHRKKKRAQDQPSAPVVRDKEVEPVAIQQVEQQEAPEPPEPASAPEPAPAPVIKTDQQSGSLFLHTEQGQQYLREQSERMGALDEEAVKIEEELAIAAQQLERTNAEVAELRQRLAQKESPSPPPPPPSEPKREKSTSKAKHKK